MTSFGVSFDTTTAHVKTKVLINVEKAMCVYIEADFFK